MNELQKHIEKFRVHLFELEEDMTTGKDLATSKVIDLISSFTNFYRSVDTETVQLRWTEYCSIMSNILSNWANSNSSVNKDQLRILAIHKSVLSSIFLSGYDSEQRALLRCFKKENKYKQNFTKVLLLISINNMNKELFRGYQTAPDLEALYLSAGWLSERTQMTKYASVYHQKLIDDFSRFDKLSIDLDFISFLSKSYMYTTYSNSVGKDNIKAVTHNLISRAIHKYSDKRALSFSRKELRKRPKIIVVHEYFADTHVMMRCHLSILSKLDEEFDISHLTWSDENFSETANQVKEVITCPDDLSSIISYIKMLGPDIILYPSIGMNTLVIALASLRLAPIQLQLFGHPSSSHSSVIDGSLHNNNLGFVNSGPEKLSIYEGYKEGMYMPFTLKKLKSKIVHDPISKLTKKLNIAINAKVMKLCPDFMIFLRRIDWPENTQLNFFPAETGTEYFACSNTIHRYFPTAKVHHMSDYESFMRELAVQDLAICSFPFGNTNGILDCLYLGLPTFALRGEEICSAPESQILSIHGLQEFIYLNKEKFSQAITKFLVDDDWRDSVCDVFKLKSELYRDRNNCEAAQQYEARKHQEWILNSIKLYDVKNSPSTQMPRNENQNLLVSHI